MEPEFKSKYNTHLIRVIVVMLVLGVGVVAARAIFIPEDFGDLGHYRTGAVEDEMNLPIRNQTNDSCLQCHPFIKKIHLAGTHKTVSCEFCHGPNADHVADGKKIADMPVKRDKDIQKLCLKCHNKIIRARPEEHIKVIAFPQHLVDKKVRTENLCNQCHHVHDPMKWIIESKKMMGLIKEEARYPWLKK